MSVASTFAMRRCASGGTASKMFAAEIRRKRVDRVRSYRAKLDEALKVNTGAFAHTQTTRLEKSHEAVREQQKQALDGMTAKIPGGATLQRAGLSAGQARAVDRSDLKGCQGTVRDFERACKGVRSAWVVRAVGVEPTLHKEADFKSAASTNFATPALISLA